MKSLRSKTIRLAASMSPGSPGRKALLDLLAASKLQNAILPLVGGDKYLAEELADTFDEVLTNAIYDTGNKALKQLPKTTPKFSKWKEQYEGTEDEDDPDIYYSLRVRFAQHARVEATAKTNLHKYLLDPRAWGRHRVDSKLLQQIIATAPAKAKIKAMGGVLDDPPRESDLRRTDIIENIEMEMTEDRGYDEHAQTTGPDDDDGFGGGYGEFPDTMTRFRTRFETTGGQVQLKGTTLFVQVFAEFIIELTDVDFPWDYGYGR